MLINNPMDSDERGIQEKPTKGIVVIYSGEWAGNVSVSLKYWLDLSKPSESEVETLSIRHHRRGDRSACLAKAAAKPAR